jgi:hypothetical protein
MLDLVSRSERPIPQDLRLSTYACYYSAGKFCGEFAKINPEKDTDNSLSNNIYTTLGPSLVGPGVPQLISVIRLNVPHRR